MELNYYYCIERNAYWSKRLGWNWTDFGAVENDKVLADNIAKFQLKYNLRVDGICGNTSHRRLMLEKSKKTKPKVEWPEKKFLQKGLLHNGIPDQIDIPIFSVNAIGGPFGKGYGWRAPDKRLNLIVIHWDVCFHTRGCLRELKRSGWSSHLGIDNRVEGHPLSPVYQFLDTSLKAFHSGTKRNDDSIGIDLSNAVYPIHNDWYIKNGFGPRPLVSDFVHGQHFNKGDILGFYPEQIASLKVLLKFLCKRHDIPFTYPKDDNGEPITTVYEPVLKGEWRGVVNHFHLVSEKVDCAGFPYKEVFDENNE